MLMSASQAHAILMPSAPTLLVVSTVSVTWGTRVMDSLVEVHACMIFDLMVTTELYNLHCYMQYWNLY